MLEKITIKNILSKLKELFNKCIYTSIDDVVFVKEITQEQHKLKNNIRVIEANYQNVEVFYRENPELIKNMSRIVSYLDNHYKGAIAELDGKMIGFVWWTDAQKNEPQYRHPHLKRYNLELNDDEAWGFDLFILPEFRGGNVASDFFFLFRKHLREKGYSRVWGFAQADNLPAMWVHKLQKYENVATVTSHLFLGNLLLSNVAGGRWFIRNVSFFGKQKFDYRFLF